MRYQRTTGFWLTGVIAAVSLGLVALPSPNTAMADPSTTQTTHTSIARPPPRGMDQSTILSMALTN